MSKSTLRKYLKGLKSFQMIFPCFFRLPVQIDKRNNQQYRDGERHGDLARGADAADYVFACVVHGIGVAREGEVMRQRGANDHVDCPLQARLVHFKAQQLPRLHFRADGHRREHRDARAAGDHADGVRLGRHGVFAQDALHLAGRDVLQRLGEDAEEQRIGLLGHAERDALRDMLVRLVAEVAVGAHRAVVIGLEVVEIGAVRLSARDRVHGIPRAAFQGRCRQSF